jgi:hypothetical protein
METSEPTIEAVKTDVKPTYEPPKIAVLNADEVLKVFQMTASEISAAGCWWSGGATSQ